MTKKINAVQKVIESGADIVAIDVTSRDERFKIFEEIRERYKDAIFDG